MKAENHLSQKVYFYKGIEFNDQLKVVFYAFKDGVKSMLEVETETQVRRDNICRIVNRLEQSESIFFVEKRKCKITGERVKTYTTNVLFKPEDNQLKLWS